MPCPQGSLTPPSWTRMTHGPPRQTATFPLLASPSSNGPSSWKLSFPFKFIWLHRLSVVARRIFVAAGRTFSCGICEL